MLKETDCNYAQLELPQCGCTWLDKSSIHVTQCQLSKHPQNSSVHFLKIFGTKNDSWNIMTEIKLCINWRMHWISCWSELHFLFFTWELQDIQKDFWSLKGILLTCRWSEALGMEDWNENFNILFLCYPLLHCFFVKCYFFSFWQDLCLCCRFFSQMRFHSWDEMI